MRSIGATPTWWAIVFVLVWMGPGGWTSAVVAQEASSPVLRVSVSPDARGRTLLKLLGPTGYQVRVSEAGRELHSDAVPTTVEVQGDHFYRVQYLDAAGRTVADQRVEARLDQVQTVEFVSAPSAVPAAGALSRAGGCLDPAEQHRLKDDLQKVDFDAHRVKLLESALARRTLCIEQARDVLTVFEFSTGRVGAAKALALHLDDLSQVYRLLADLEWEAERKLVRYALEQAGHKVR
jgi:hypothetical protein